MVNRTNQLLVMEKRLNMALGKIQKLRSREKLRGWSIPVPAEPGKRHHGRVPYGMRRREDGILELVPEEQKKIQLIRKYAREGVTIAGIKEGLELSISLPTISRIISSEKLQRDGKLPRKTKVDA